MELNNRGGINIVIISVMFVVLISVSFMIHQVNRMIESNGMYYDKNEARNLAIALEEKYLKHYEDNIGKVCGKINNKTYIVSISEGDEGFNIFIVVEFGRAIYTIDLLLNSEGEIIKRLDNVPKGDITC